MTRLLRLFPREWRERYGREVEEALEHSTRPARDRLDLVRAAVSVRRQDVRSRLEQAVRRAGLGVLSGAALLSGAAGAWWAQANLSEGLGEIPRHWWSTAACLPLVAAVLLAAWWSAGRFGNRRRRAREGPGQSL